MLILRLACRNLIGAGLRTWLNVAVLAFTCVLAIWHQGLLAGMFEYSAQAAIEEEVGGGQFWHSAYDPYDPIALDESHGRLTSALQALVREGRATPILLRPAAAYPEGRLQPVMLRGIDPLQSILALDTSALAATNVALPIVLGQRMAGSLSLKVGDPITVRWRDANGTFDAAEGAVVAVMKTKSATVDKGILWVPLATLQTMTDLTGQATIVVVGDECAVPADDDTWTFRDSDFLLADLRAMVRSKQVGGMIMYAVLLSLAMLAVFDTQILSIWRRRKEIGTLMALGMGRRAVISLFTLEGMLHGVLALGLAALCGWPLLQLSARKGIPMPASTDDYGYAFAARLFPSYSFAIVGITVLAIMVVITIVSYLPSHKISDMSPTEALKGKAS